MSTMLDGQSIVEFAQEYRKFGFSREKRVNDTNSNKINRMERMESYSESGLLQLMR